nr:immunoglobulin light chain junction region [Macaca mulatta]MOW65089.1 immunoglobulin light chain junction region [Macaca mulatta]MOW65462.1 immunoglobulin light chain junction region [Macaca mulatta]
CHKYTTPPLTF